MKKSMSVNAILNLIKQICQIIFPLITFPYISRILGPEGYGEYSYSSTIVNYFLLLSSFGVSSYSIREGAKIREDSKKLNEFSNQVFTISVMTMAISYIAMDILLFTNLKIRQYIVLILIQSISMLLTTIGADWINVIYEDYLYITVRYIAIQIIALFSIFLFVKSKEDIFKYCLIAVLASNGGNIINVFYIRKYVRLRLTAHPHIGKHFIPMLILFVNAIAISIYVNADITMIGIYYSNEEVGIYSFASKIYNLLKMMVNALVVVTVPRMASLVQSNKDGYKVAISNISSSITVVLLPISVGLCCMSKSIITLAGGYQYLGGSNALKILSLAIIPAIYSSITTNCVLVAARKEKYCLIATVISAVVNIGLNFVLIPIIGPIGAAITTVIAETVNVCIQYSSSKELIGRFYINLRLIMTCILGCVYIGAICLICNLIFTSDLMKLITAVAFSVIGYCAIIWVRDRNTVLKLMKYSRN